MEMHRCLDDVELVEVICSELRQLRGGMKALAVLATRNSRVLRSIACGTISTHWTIPSAACLLTCSKHTKNPAAQGSPAWCAPLSEFVRDFV
jgi:hypothetical protein